MVEIIATPEQEAALAKANPSEAIVLRNANGAFLALGTTPQCDGEWTAGEIARAKKSLSEPGPRYTTAEVLAHCRSLAPEEPVE